MDQVKPHLEKIFQFVSVLPGYTYKHWYQVLEYDITNSMQLKTDHQVYVHVLTSTKILHPIH